MTTPRIRTLVSLAAALTLTLPGCTSVSAHEATVASDAAPLAFRFDNGAREFVHVYLVGAQREWLLGRVEPGAHGTLRMPAEALAEDAGTMRLAVLTGQRATLRAISEPRAVVTPDAQPAAEILSQRWSFAQTVGRSQLTALRTWQ